MNKKLVRDYLIITFVIMVVCWGILAALSRVLDITTNSVFLIISLILNLLGGMSPTIASYISLRRNNVVLDFKDWLKKSFDVKHLLFVYIVVLAYVVVYFLVGCLVSDFEIGAPFYAILVIAPMMLFGGGNEEVGWRMILQPELEKKFNFYISALLVGVVWWLWHGPLYLVKGIVNERPNYLYFGIMCIALSFALATIRKVSNGVFPCILTHCLINGFAAIFIFDTTLISSLSVLAATFVLSVIILSVSNKINEKKKQK